MRQDFASLTFSAQCRRPAPALGSKFSAWVWFPDNPPIVNDHGIRLQYDLVRDGQYRQVFENEGFGKEQVPCSGTRASPSTVEFRFEGKQEVNVLGLDVNGKATLADLKIEYSTGQSDWRLCRLMPFDAGYATSSSPRIPFDTVSTDVIRVTLTDPSVVLDDSSFFRYYFDLDSLLQVEPLAKHYSDCLFTFGDEPDGTALICSTETAKAYERFVETVLRGSGGVARVSPPMFAHFESLESFYRHNAAPVDEWRLDMFWSSPNDFEIWKKTVLLAADWAVSHGAPLVLASWGSTYPDVQLLKEAMSLIKQDSRIIDATFYTYRQANIAQDPFIKLADPVNNTLTEWGYEFLKNMH
jgi:hypothetical protein